MKSERFTVRVPYPKGGLAPGEFALAEAARDQGARIRGKGRDRKSGLRSISPDYLFAEMTFDVYGVGDEPVQTYEVEVRVSGHIRVEVDAASEEEAGDMGYDLALEEAAWAVDLDGDVESVRLKDRPVNTIKAEAV